MVNASVKIRTVQALSLKRSLDSRNDLVRGLSWRVYRDTLPFVDVHTNIFCHLAEGITFSVIYLAVCLFLRCLCVCVCLYVYFSHL